MGKELTIPISVTASSVVYYYFLNIEGNVIDTGTKQSDTGNMTIILSKEKTSLLSVGANDLKIFVISESALKPDLFHTSFLGIQGENQTLPENFGEVTGPSIVGQDFVVIGIVLSAITIGVTFALRKRKKP